jgi:hypothetical protein
MVTKQTLKTYDYANVEDYFDYIVESHVNGQFAQVRELFGTLSKNQKAELLAYLQDGTKDQIACREYLLRQIFKP